MPSSFDYLLYLAHVVLQFQLVHVLPQGVREVYRRAYFYHVDLALCYLVLQLQLCHLQLSDLTKAPPHRDALRGTGNHHQLYTCLDTEVAQHAAKTYGVRGPLTMP